MRKWHNHNSSALKRKLLIFDFDDTIASTECKVIIRYPDGSSEKMSTEDFKNHQKKEANEYDFSEFEKVINPKVNDDIVSIIRHAVDARSYRDEIIVLTARQSASRPAVKTFLSSLGLNVPKSIELVTLDDSRAQAKADWVEKKIKAGITEILFMDDSRANVEAVRYLFKRYPQVIIDAREVSHAEEAF